MDILLVLTVGYATGAVLPEPYVNPALFQTEHIGYISADAFTAKGNPPTEPLMLVPADHLKRI